jgi:hypothetical protein
MVCQERSTIRRLISAGELSKQLRRVKEDILDKVMLATFAINAHTTNLLLTIQAGSQPPLRQRLLLTSVVYSDPSYNTRRNCIRPWCDFRSQVVFIYPLQI